MKKHEALLILLITLASTAHAGIEGVITPHKAGPSTKIWLEYEIDVDYSGPAELKICLAEYDFEVLRYNYRCDYELKRLNLEIPGEYPPENFSFSLPSSMYRFYLELKAGGRSYRDSDKDNIVLFLNEIPSIKYVETQTIGPAVTVSANIPEEALQHQEFETNVNITNNHALETLRVYSYAYDNGILVSEGYYNGTWAGGWTANEHQISLDRGSSAIITLKNRINKTGMFDFKIRAVAGNERFDLKNTISVLPRNKPLILIDSIRHQVIGNAVVSTVSVSNKGNSSQPVQVLFKSANHSISLNDSLNSKRTKELSFNTSLDNQTIHVFALVNNTLIDYDSKTIEVKNPTKQENKTQTVIKNKDRGKNYSKEEQNQEVPTETVLYSLEIISLLGLLILLKRV